MAYEVMSRMQKKGTVDDGNDDVESENECLLLLLTEATAALEEGEGEGALCSFKPMSICAPPSLIDLFPLR